MIVIFSVSSDIDEVIDENLLNKKYYEANVKRKKTDGAAIKQRC